MPVFNPAIFNPVIFNTAFASTATGTPTYPWVLFRGQVTGVRAERIDQLLKLHIEAADYNRLWSLFKVGVPVAGIYLTQPDGTDLNVDPDALNFGIGGGDGGVFKHFVDVYLAALVDIGLDYDALVHNTNPLYAGIPVLDWQTANTDLKSVLSEFSARQGPYAAFWLRSATLEAAYTLLAPHGTVSEFAEPAPWDLDSDGAGSGNRIMPMSMSAGTDRSPVRRRIRIRGGTPDSIVWVTAPLTDPLAGEDFVDAPGAVTEEEAETIGLWHLNNNFRAQVSGGAHVPAGYDGWRVGQTGYFTDSVLSRLVGVALADTPSIIRQVKATAVSPGPGLTFTIAGLVGIDDDISARVTVQSLDIEEIGWAEAGKATLVMEIFLEVGETVYIPDLAELVISTDGTAEIEYDLEFGDPAPGSLAIQADRGKPIEFLPPPRPVYHFERLLSDLDIPVGGSAVIVFQLVDALGRGVALAGVAAELVVVQWADEGETVPATEFEMTDPVGETNSFGQIYTFLERLDVPDAEKAVKYEPLALALPVP